jgi:hypothetical protein
MNTVTTYLVHVHHIPNTAPIIKKFIQQIETHLHEQYMTPLSYRDIYRTRKEFKLLKSIESKLKKGKYILRFTDKSGIFHLSHASIYGKKSRNLSTKNGCLY